MHASSINRIKRGGGVITWDVPYPCLMKSVFTVKFINNDIPREIQIEKKKPVFNISCVVLLCRPIFNQLHSI